MVLQAGRENPSETLLPYPGWDAQAQPPLGGSLSRYTSFGSAASALAVGGGGGSGGGRGKPTVWGQGMRRRPFIGSSSAPVGVLPRNIVDFGGSSETRCGC
jgi:hypothetical protein